MFERECVGGKYRTILQFAVWAAGLFFFLVIIHIFKFEKNEELYATSPPSQESSQAFHVSHVEQAFRLSPGRGRFNKITVVLHNPSKRDIPFRFTLRSIKSRKVLYRTQIILKRGANRDNPVEIPVRPIRLYESRDFYFELDSLQTFGVVTSPENPGPGFATNLDDRPFDEHLLFRVTNTERNSLLTWAFRARGQGRTAILLELLSLILWLSACRYFSVMTLSLPKPDIAVVSGGRYQALPLTLAALSLFCLIGVMLLADANVHAHLLGAEDDAHITYRYARNVAEGKGLRFNPDEKVLGTTSPLYTLILAFLTVFFGKTHVVSLGLNLASILGSGLILNRLLSRRLAPTAGLAGGLIFVFFPMFYRIMGMETNFLIFLVLVGLFLLDAGKTRWAAFVIGLAVLTRMEAALLWPLACLSLASRKKYREAWTFTGVFLLTLAPWFTFSLLYFEMLFPNAFHIKTIFNVSEGSVQSLIRTLSTINPRKSEWLKGFATYLPDYIEHYAVWVGSSLVALIVAARDVWKTEALRMFLFWTVLYISAYTALGVWLFVWYYVLALAFIPLVLAIAINKISETIKIRLPRALAAATTVLLLSSLILFEARDVFNFFTGQWYSFHTGHVERYETYTDMAGFIRERVPDDKTVALVEIGILGYFIPNKVWDFYSLVHNPRIYHIEMPGENLPFLLTLMDPDYLVLNSDRLTSRVPFQNYENVRIFPVQEFPWAPFFFYTLLRKKPGSLIPCGDVQCDNRLAGTRRVSGWVVGSAAVGSVGISKGGRVIAETDVLTEPPDEIRAYIGRNPHSRKASFHIDLDTTQLPNGAHELEFWARSGSKNGIFYRKTVTIAN